MTPWTREQAAAITATHHTMLVANAGTGKTTTVIGKVLWLLGEDVGRTEDGEAIERCPNPCKLSEIAAITFTEKAAYDLKRKLRERIRKSPRAHELLWEIDRATVGTIHSFCGSLLRENALRLGIDPTFRILDEAEAKLRQNSLIRDSILEHIQAGDDEVAEVFREKGLYSKEWTQGSIDYVRTVLRDLRWHRERYGSWSRNGALDDGILAQHFGAPLHALDAKIVSRCRALHRVASKMLDVWSAHEADENVRDYDSLILDTRALLLSDAGAPALARIRERYRILIIDEFQDTDGAQRDIAYAIAREQARPQLFVVGDPKQSIYRFRGADISVWNSVAGDLSGIAAPLPLTRNFRSDPLVVRAANAASAVAIDATADGVESEWRGESIRYAELVPSRASAGVGTVEWLEPMGDKAEDSREYEGAHIAARIQKLINDKEQVIDIDSGQKRDCKFSDIAVLYRARTGVEPYKAALRRAGIPLHDQSPAGLSKRQEIYDVVNYLRVLHNRSDDLRAFGLLRSPFIGLRDEVIARIQLFTKGSTLLRKADEYCRNGEWFAAMEHPGIAEIERSALRRGLDLFDDARRLADRVPIDELLSFVLDESGYRDHMLLLEGHREALANLRSFVQVCEQHRDLSLGAFLEMWDQRDEKDPGIPQGQVFSAKDDFVTFSTIHAAKGLEWPVVFLVDVATELDDRPANAYWSDPLLGPVLCPKQDERGPRALRMRERRRVQELAEDARVMYVGLTRARDKLIITGQIGSDSFGAWLEVLRREELVAVDDSVAEPKEIEPRSIELSWLDQVTPTATSQLAQRAPEPPHRFLTSATELMTRSKNPEEWERRYIHGIEAPWFFAPAHKPGEPRVTAALHGTIVHGVLERITEEAELAHVLEETIGELDMPELESMLSLGSDYRAALEAEIESVIKSDEWKWYVEGEHYRELPFVHLVGPREWRIGAFDLYRPDGWIIDFKTHDVEAAKVEEVAEDYRIQAEIYTAAVAAIRGPAKMRLHFTKPNVVVEL